MADVALLDRDCSPLIGLTVHEVIATLGLPVAECCVFDEPPGVGRGLKWFGPNGLHVSIWVARQAGIFRRNRKWDGAEFYSRRVVGIQIWPGQPGQGVEWWAGGSRFNVQSQTVTPDPKTDRPRDVS